MKADICQDPREGTGVLQEEENRELFKWVREVFLGTLCARDLAGKEGQLCPDCQSFIYHSSEIQLWSGGGASQKAEWHHEGSSGLRAKKPGNLPSQSSAILGKGLPCSGSHFPPLSNERTELNDLLFHERQVKHFEDGSMVTKQTMQLSAGAGPPHPWAFWLTGSGHAHAYSHVCTLCHTPPSHPPFAHPKVIGLKCFWDPQCLKDKAKSPQHERESPS